MDDLRALATALRERGIALTLDLVVNHVAREHEWAVRARAGEKRYREYFHVFDDRGLPDAYEATLPEVFPDFAPGSFTWDDEIDGWVWTTFNSWQWDLNWHNPDVFLEMADVVLYLANAGVECLRLDAIAFLWKRMGTSCQNQPEVHAITQALHAVSKIMAPALIFKAEAIVGPEDLVPYLGVGEHAGKVSDLAYHNSLMVQTWSALAASDARLASAALRRFAAKPTHDGVGDVRPLPRRHRLGGRRRGCRGGRLGRVRAPQLPLRLVRRDLPGQRRPRPGVPAQPGDRRPADQRDGGLAGRARGGARERGRRAHRHSRSGG